MKNRASVNRDWIASARTLSEALPYLQRYDNAVIVIKFGGHAMEAEDALDSFARDIVLMKQVGVNPVIVHGGGPKINAMLAELGIVSEFIAGKRITDEKTVEVVEMVLSGSINKRIVQAINKQGGKAAGISGKDGRLMICGRAQPELGFVGEPEEIDPGILQALFDKGFIPVVAPLASGRNGETLNVNGDTAAGAIAMALKADRLLLLTDVEGVKDENGNVLTQISPSELRRLTASGIVDGGMIPKTETAMRAVENGVRAAVILDGRAPNAVLLELFTNHGAGSLIRSKPARPIA